MKVPLFYTEVSVANKDPRKTMLDKRAFVPQINCQSFEATQDLHMLSGKHGYVMENQIKLNSLNGFAIGAQTEARLDVSQNKSASAARGLPESKTTGRKPGKVDMSGKQRKGLGERGLE